jgi:cobyrinic acid a,c-diamide synthase
MAMGQMLVDAQGVEHRMAGLLGLETSFAKRRMHLGYRLAELQAPIPVMTRVLGCGGMSSIMPPSSPSPMRRWPMWWMPMARRCPKPGRAGAMPRAASSI